MVDSQAAIEQTLPEVIVRGVDIFKCQIFNLLVDFIANLALVFVEKSVHDYIREQLNPAIKYFVYHQPKSPYVAVGAVLPLRHLRATV